MLPCTATSCLPPAGSSRGTATRHNGLTEEFAHPLGDETAIVFQREMPGINQVQFCFQNVSLVGFGSFNRKERIVLPPEDQHSRLSVAEVLVPTVIEREIRLIVVKQIELNFSVPRTIEEELVHGIAIRADSVRICNTVCVLKDGHLFRQEIAHRLLGLGVAIGPEWLHWIERAANTLRVSVAVLNDNALNSIWML